MHFTSTAHSSRDRGFSLTEVSVVLGIISILTMSVAWIMDQASHIMNATQARVRSQMPHLEITSPSGDLNSPALVRVTWDWRKAGNGADEDVPAQYSTLYSRDAGQNWQNMMDDSPARPGVRPDIQYLTSDVARDWSLPIEKFPQGNYIIRVEAFGDEVPEHYAFDQFKTFIKR